jgi:hypothetical protein
MLVLFLKKIHQVILKFNALIAFKRAQKYQNIPGWCKFLSAVFCRWHHNSEPAFCKTRVGQEFISCKNVSIHPEKN